MQYEAPVDTSDLLLPTETNLIQNVVETFLYYVLAINNTVLVAFNNISLQQSSANKNNSKKFQKY